MSSPHVKVKRRSQKAGLSPGELVGVTSQEGEDSSRPTRISVISYSPDTLEEQEISDIEQLRAYRDNGRINWIKVEGISEPAVIEKVGGIFEVHPLALEDILNPNKRPKAEDYESFVFVILRTVNPDSTPRKVRSEQISLVLGRGFVLSFHQYSESTFDVIKNRIRQAKGRIRRSNSDFLAYSLIDAAVDGYFSVLEWFGEEVDRVEQRVTVQPDAKLLRHMHKLRRTSFNLRRAAWPHRELVGSLIRSESELIDNTTRIYLRDVYDHTVEIVDIIETMRESISSQMEVYLSGINNRMSSVMVVLAVVSTIFMPLTFIAGVYGMNFQFMPELSWTYGYPAVLLLMLAIAIVMLFLFRRKDWI